MSLDMLGAPICTAQSRVPLNASNAKQTVPNKDHITQGWASPTEPCLQLLFLPQVEVCCSHPCREAGNNLFVMDVCDETIGGQELTICRQAGRPAEGFSDLDQSCSSAADSCQILEQ